MDKLLTLDMLFVHLRKYSHVYPTVYMYEVLQVTITHSYLRSFYLLNQYKALAVEAQKSVSQCVVRYTEQPGVGSAQQYK